MNSGSKNSLRKTTAGHQILNFFIFYITKTVFIFEKALPHPRRCLISFIIIHRFFLTIQNKNGGETKLSLCVLLLVKHKKW
jgi:hypothetical protein